MATTPNKHLSSLFFLIFPLIPLVISLFLLGEEAVHYIVWCLCFVGFALIGAPLAKRLFPESPDGGWIYGMMLGLLIPSFLVWLLAHLKLPMFSRLGIVLVLVITAFHFYFIKGRKFRIPKPFTQFTQRTFRLRALETAMLFAAFFFWTFLRTLKPEIYGLEKFMDYGFMMSMMRTNTLPAADMWLAGSSINYYYYGQYLFTFITKLAGTLPAIAYNLSIAASFAFSFSLGFAIVRDILETRLSSEANLNISSEILEGKNTNHNKYRIIREQIVPSVGGLLGASLLTLAGNSHAFFYGTDRLGNGLVEFLQRSGFNVGTIGNFFFSDSTRFIGYNPDTMDKTIHEFPFYSYLVADLHAHMVNLSIVLLLLAVLFAMARNLKIRRPGGPGRHLDLGANQPILQTKYYQPQANAKERTVLYLITLGFLLGISAMANYWDFVIYVVVAVFVFFSAAVMKYSSKNSLNTFGLFFLILILVFAPFLFLKNSLLQLIGFAAVFALSVWLYRKQRSAWTATGLVLAGLFFLAHLVALPFNWNFDPMAKSFALAENHSGIYQLLILWFAHGLIGVLFLVYYFVYAAKDGALKGKPFLKKLFDRHPNDVFTAVLIVCGFGLILAPEILYVRDIYEGSFSRANTMFKFTYQAFAMLSLTAAVSLGVFLQRFIPRKAKASLRSHVTTEESLEMPKRYRGKRAKENPDVWVRDAVLPLVLTSVLLLLPFSYTRELKSWYGDLSQERSASLEGDNYLGTIYMQDEAGEYFELSHRLALIDYLNAEVQGQPVVLEAFGDSYSDYNSLSAYTGLPTVLGWQTHEWLWRTSATVQNAFGEVVAPLQEEIRAFYEARYPETMQAFIRDHEIEYIVVGEQERIKFPLLAEDTLFRLGTIVFQSGTDYLIKVGPAG